MLLKIVSESKAPFCRCPFNTSNNNYENRNHTVHREHVLMLNESEKERELQNVNIDSLSWLPFFYLIRMSDYFSIPFL